MDWLTKPVLYDKGYLTKDVLNLMISGVIEFVNDTPELEFNYDEQTFREKFYKMMYSQYYLKDIYQFVPYDEEMYDYFNTKFSENILDLFLYFRYLTNCYDLDLLHKKHDNYLSIQEFLFDYLAIEDPYYDSEEDEENVDYSIDE